MWRQAVLSVSFPLVLITFAAGLTILAGTRLAYPSETPDPFAPYEAIMPGQRGISSESLCDSSITYRFGEAFDCEIRPIYGFFVSVTSTVYHDRIVQTSFMAHDWSVGDIVSHWGRPDSVIKDDNRAFHLYWEEQGFIGVVVVPGSVEHFSYMLRVEQFTISVQPDNHP